MRVRMPQARSWVMEHSSKSDEMLWPKVVQDALEEEAREVRGELEAAMGETEAARAETKAIAAEFSSYKARAHTALKKVTSSGAEDKRKDEVRLPVSVVRWWGLLAIEASVCEVFQCRPVALSPRTWTPRLGYCLLKTIHGSEPSVRGANFPILGVVDV